jgi:hypothetical protein
MCSEEVNGRHKYEPAEDASGKEHSGNARSDDVTDAEIFRRSLSAKRRTGQPLGFVIGCAGPRAEQIFVLKECVESAESESEEDAAGEGASAAMSTSAQAVPSG